MISKKREQKMQYYFYLNGDFYYCTFKGRCYVVVNDYDNNTSKTMRISNDNFSSKHAERYDY